MLARVILLVFTINSSKIEMLRIDMRGVPTSFVPPDMKLHLHQVKYFKGQQI